MITTEMQAKSITKRAFNKRPSRKEYNNGIPKAVRRFLKGSVKSPTPFYTMTKEMREKAYQDILFHFRSQF